MFLHCVGVVVVFLYTYPLQLSLTTNQIFSSNQRGEEHFQDTTLLALFFLCDFSAIFSYCNESFFIADWTDCIRSVKDC